MPRMPSLVIRRPRQSVLLPAGDFILHVPRLSRKPVSAHYKRLKDVKVEELVPNNLEEDLSNYDEWKQQINKVIADNDLLGFIDGTVEVPVKVPPIIRDVQPDAEGTTSQTENREYVEWKKSDELVQNWIRNRLSKNIENRLGKFETAKELWEALRTMVEATAVNRLYMPLYDAATKGDWNEAKKLVEEKPYAVSALLKSETALMTAGKVVKVEGFLEQFLGMVKAEDLNTLNHNGRTALHMAVEYGNFKLAKLLVKKKPDMAIQVSETKDMPLYYAALRGDREMINWLMNLEDMKNKRLEGEPGFRILFSLTKNRLYDIALTVLKDNPELASFIPEKEVGCKLHASTHPLTALAGNPSSFPSGNNYNFLQRFIYSMLAEDNSGAANGTGDKKDTHVGDNPGDVEAPLASDNSGASNGSCGSAVNKILLAIVWKAIIGGCCSAVKKILRAIAWKAIKNIGILVKPIEAKKKENDQALELLQLLCKAIIGKIESARQMFHVPLENATAVGITEIVEEILQLYPYAVSLENNEKQTIFHQAIVFRQEKVFNVICQHEEYMAIFLLKSDIKKNNALHLAADVVDPPQYLSAAAAFQMQRELQWFQEVEKHVPQRCKDDWNENFKTPAQVFSNKHNELLKEGERWMKDTASSCTIIASLIATVVFAAAIQVPGGNHDNGHPIFFQQRAFIIFGIFNGLALFSSVASVVMFLSILICSFAEKDFCFALPNRLIIALICLFVSILFTMVAFGAILYLVFGENKEWILIPIVVEGCLPVIFFGGLQFPLLRRMIKSTYGSGIFGNRRWFGLAQVREGSLFSLLFNRE